MTVHDRNRDSNIDRENTEFECFMIDRRGKQAPYFSFSESDDDDDDFQSLESSTRIEHVSIDR
jgi:hypothetical protein